MKMEQNKINERKNKIINMIEYLTPLQVNEIYSRIKNYLGIEDTLTNKSTLSKCSRSRFSAKNFKLVYSDTNISQAKEKLDHFFKGYNISYRSSGVNTIVFINCIKKKKT